MELTPQEREIILRRREAAKVDATLTEEEQSLIANGRTLQMEDIRLGNSPERKQEIRQELARLAREAGY